MQWRRRLLTGVNVVANRAGLHVLSHAEYNYVVNMFLPRNGEGHPMPKAAREYLRADHPHLDDLRRRYRNHPAAEHSQWMEQNLLADLKLHEFRRDSYYIWQTRWTKPETYLLTAYYVREHDQLGLFGRLTEDGLFGATTVPFEDGYLLSRDLLDSMNEINLVAHWLGLRRDSAVSVLDIGSGYGRLAHRLVDALPRATVVCVDAVPVSSFLCAFYVGFRGCGHRAEVVPLDQAAELLAGREFDLVTNIHSFSECPVSAIEWWLQCLDEVKVRNLLIVPNDGARLLSVEVDGTRRDFAPLLDQYGWHASRLEPTYSSEVARRYALFPEGCFRLFSR